MRGEATTISQLPVQLLARILAVLKPAERLGSAALVATAWRTAAVQGTDSIRLPAWRTAPVLGIGLDNLSESEGESEADASGDESGDEPWGGLEPGDESGDGDESGGESEPENSKPAKPKPAKPITWPERFDSLSAWLAANSNAGLSQFLAFAPTVEPPVLQLPSLQQLPGLECLSCEDLVITVVPASRDSSQAGAAVAAAAEAAGAASLLLLELSLATALTALQLKNCRVEVQGLAALTRLQSLTLGARSYSNLPEAVTSNLRSQLQHALPQLQALTSLCLTGEVARDDVLQHVSSLPGLQLLSMDGMFTLASFQQLPQSLTQLSIDWAGSSDDDGDTSQKLSATTAPGLCALTGLQVFEVRSGAVSLELIGSLTSMKRLGCAYDQFSGLGVSLEGPGTLSVLTALTQLTYMVLPALDEEAVPSDEDTAAVTAPPQLQVLDISNTDMRAAYCRHMFAAGRQLSQLTELCANLDLIPGGREASLVAACCPNLASIAFPVEPQYGVGEVDLASMLAGWQSLQHLTNLILNTGQLELTPEVWGALGRHAQLQKLDVRCDVGCSIGLLAGILELSSLQKLKVLDVECKFRYPDPPQSKPRARYSYGPLTKCLPVKLTSKRAADGTTTLAQQLPKALLRAMQDKVSCDRAPEAYSVIVAAQREQLQQQRALAKAQKQQRQQEQAVAKAQQQQLEQLQVQNAQLQQEVGGLQAKLAAALSDQA